MKCSNPQGSKGESREHTTKAFQIENVSQQERDFRLSTHQENVDGHLNRYTQAAWLPSITKFNILDSFADLSSLRRNRYK